MEWARNRRGGSLMVQTKTEKVAMKRISHNFKLKVGHIGSSFIFGASHIISAWVKT